VRPTQADDAADLAPPRVAASRTVLSTQLVIERILVGEVDVPLRHGTLVVAARVESARLDWEVVVHSLQPVAIAQEAHRLQLRCLVGHDRNGKPTMIELSGPAFLVRSVGETHVFRGDGALDGFDIGLLAG